MIQRFHRPVATWLSTNHPVLWVARWDVAVLLTVTVLVLGLATAWAGAMAKRAILRLAPDLLTTEGALALLYNFHVILDIVLAVLGAAAAIVWFATVTKSMYKAVAPRMRMYPRVVDLFAVLLLIGGATATAIIVLDWVMTIQDADETGVVLGLQFIATRYLAYAIEPAVVLAAIFAVILRWSLGAALGLTTVAVIIAICMIFVGVSLEKLVPPGTSAAERDMLTIGFMGSVSLIWLVAALLVAQSRRNSRVKNTFVALTVPLLTVGVAAIEGGIMGPLSYLFPTVKGPPAVFLFFGVHTVATVLLVHWLCIRWAKLDMRPS
jgi:hypothetical protein